MAIGQGKPGNLGSTYLIYLSKESIVFMLTKLSNPPANQTAINHVKVTQVKTPGHKATTFKVKQRSTSKADK